MDFERRLILNALAVSFLVKWIEYSIFCRLNAKIYQFKEYPSFACHLINIQYNVSMELNLLDSLKQGLIQISILHLIVVLFSRIITIGS
jgi:hypothetical protein